MARNSFKSFCKIFQLSNLGSSSVELRDTAGSAIYCNYIRVDSRSIDNFDLGWYHVYPNGVYQNDVQLTSTSGSPSASGAPGVAGVADGTVEYLMPNGTKYQVSSVTIVNHLGGTGSFALTYGVLSSASEMADTMLSRLNGTKGV